MTDSSGDIVIIEPVRKFRGIMLTEFISHRELLYFLVWRDLKVRYRQTFLGVFWVVLQPLLMMGIYSVIFGSFVRLPHGNYPYALFVLAGLIPWTFISNAVSDSGNSLLANAHLISKVYFPRLYLPAARVLVLLVDCTISTTLLCIIAFYFGIRFTPLFLLLLPLAFLLCISVVLGAGALLSALNVKYRDFHYIIPYALQVLMFCTPVIYPAEVIPARFRWIIDLNPLTGIVEIYRAAFLGGALRPAMLAYSIISSLLLLFAGVIYFDNVEHRFADII
jgi:lipopolysaccharide transport system permease protein